MDVNAIFGPAGVLARAFEAKGRAFEPNPDQLAVAELNSRAIDAGSGFITFIEAGTGVGKTLSYLIPAAVKAVETGRPALVSTYTIELQRQIVQKDGPVAAAALEEMGLRAPVIRARRSRRHFVSPSRVRAYRQLLVGNGGDKDTVHALKELEDWAELCLAQDLPDGVTPAPELSGMLIDWLRDAGEGRLEAVPEDRLVLTGSCPDEEQRLYRLSADLASRADIIVATHAMTAVDLRFWGQIMGRTVDLAEEHRFSAVIIDEADRFNDGAASAYGAKRSMFGAGAVLQEVQPLIAKLDGKQRVRLTELALDYDDEATGFLNDARALYEMKLDGYATSAIVAPGSPAWELLPRMQRMAKLAHELSNAMARVRDGDGAAVMATPAFDLREQAVLLDDAVRHSTGVGRAADVEISWSPVWQHPSVAVKPRNAGMIASRLWYTGVEDEPHLPMAAATIVTSATLLSAPTLRNQRHVRLANSFGLKGSDHRIKVKDPVEPRDFGRVSFMLPHPGLPPVSKRNADGSRVTNPEHQQLVASIIMTCLGDGLTERQTRRALVLATSYDDAAGYRRALGEGPADSRLHLHASGQSLNQASREWLKPVNPVGALITPAAWEGVDWPGVIDDLVITRLPFAPPTNYIRARTAEGEDEIAMGHLVDDMLRRLRQGLGRAIRQKSDVARIWIADPRFPVPLALVRDHADIEVRHANQSYLSAVPARFRDALSKGTPIRPALLVRVAPQKKDKAAADTGGEVVINELLGVPQDAE